MSTKTHNRVQIIFGASLPSGSVTREITSASGMVWSAVFSDYVNPYSHGHSGYHFFSPAIIQSDALKELAALLAAIQPLGAVITEPCDLRLRSVGSW